MSKNELAVINTQELQLVPSADDLEFVREELQTLDRMPFGRIKIGAAGAGIFQVFEPGDEDPTVATDIEGVILMSNKTNGMWLHKYGSQEADADKSPDCGSADGESGIDRETGELKDCASCPYNQFGSGADGRGKRCKNMRRLFILRPGDIFPSLLVLPPTALAPYDNYRLKIMNGRNRIYGVMTKITLKTAKNAAGTAYSVPVFTATGCIPPAEAAKVKAYADGFINAAAKVGVTADDVTGVATPVSTEFTPVDDDISQVFPEKAADDGGAYSTIE